jgi:prepilin-type N-terminal cleavage/methylation domain-containing protein
MGPLPGRLPTYEPENRSGFTLVEMLVVMGIVLLVVALLAGAAVQVLSYQRNSATETTLRTLMDPLEQQWKAVVEAAQKEPIPASVQSIASTAPNGTTLVNVYNVKRARVIWTYLRLRQAFPQNFSEALQPWKVPSNGPISQGELPSIPTYQNVLGNNNVTPSQQAEAAWPTQSWPMESGATLLLALQQGYGGSKKLDPDSLSQISTLPYPGASQGLPMPVDAWQTPLVFYRWATPLVIQPNGTVQLATSGAALELDQSSPTNAEVRDPLDPEGTLLDPKWNGPSNPGVSGVYWFEQYCRPVHYIDANGKWKVYGSYAIPVIVSAGKDALLGFTQSTFPNPPHPPHPPYPSPFLPDLMTDDGSGHSDDTIYSWRLRQGARGD